MNKLQTYSELADQKARQLTDSRQAWTRFLESAGRLYKYPFDEQLLIYAQRPDATACAPIEIWNKPMRRCVKRGSKGIALIDNSGDVARLRYVFDIADTEPGWRQNARKPNIWGLQPEHEMPVMAALAENHGAFDGDMAAGLYEIAGRLAAEYWNENLLDITSVVPGSFLEELDSFNVEVAFREALTVSAAYTIMTRCGIDPGAYFEDEAPQGVLSFADGEIHLNFQPIFDFNTSEIVYALGSGVSSISEQVLREIEVVVKNYDRQKAAEKLNERDQHERTDLQSGGRLPDPRSGIAGTTSAADREVRQDAPGVPEKAPDNIVPLHEPERDLVSAPDRDRHNSERADGTDDERIGVEDAAARQIDGSNGLDGSHEQPSDAGRRNGHDGADLQLEPAPIDEDEIDRLIAYGSHFQDGKYRIYSFFLHEHTPKEKADFLKKEYGYGGGTYYFADGSRGWLDHTPKGLTLGHVIGKPERKFNWSQVARRVDRLIAQDRYMEPDELAGIPAYENRALARELYSAFTQHTGDPEGPFRHIRDFGDAVKAIGAALNEPNGIDELIAAVRPMWAATPEDSRLFASRDHAYRNLTAYRDATFTLFPKREDDPRGNEQSGQLTLLPPDFPTMEAQREAAYEDLPAQVEAINQFDIDEAIIAWNGDPASKERVYNYMAMHARERDTATFLRAEFGGNLPAFPVEKDGTPGVLLPWAKAQRRIARLMTEHEFLPVATSEVDAEMSVEAPEAAHEPPTAEIEPSPETSDDTEELGNEPAESEPAYSVGDTVYLDSDKAFIIESIGSFDIQLRDPTLIYPIFRAESIDNFERLLRDNPLNGALFVRAELPDIEVLEPVLEAAAPTITSPILTNYRITDDHLGEGGAKTKYGFNAEAIRTLKQIEADNRHATPSEQAILSKYVGWGGLPQAFDDNNAGWAREYAELKELLTPEEYGMARSSTLNAHYTSPSVIRAIYETVERLGFTTGNVLEPSCGVGNFFGLLPQSMASSKLYGVELDSITGRIAQQLYPNADIQIGGFENTKMPDSFFDLAIGNVPFGNYGVADKRYDKNHFQIHDYFFAKTLDQVRPSGVVAFITSKGTLDKQKPDVRKYIAQRAEFLGAVRLPSDAFKKNAGTEVTADIIFLQKRDRLIDITPDWVHLGETDDGIPVNSYFIEHPDMMLGKMATESTAYGHDSTCRPIPGADLAEQLRNALSNIERRIVEIELDDIEQIVDASIPADPNVRNFSYTLVDDKLYFRENSRMLPVDLPAVTLERVRGMTEIRDCVHQLIDLQLNDAIGAAITEKQVELGSLYDAFTAKHGLLNDRANSRAYAADSAYYLLCSLEILDENGQLDRKADMFSKRTIREKTVVTSVDTAVEALAVSLSERGGVDIPYMAQLSGKDESKLIRDLQSVIFRNPQKSGEGPDRGYETADAYLSGNVRDKLRVAQEYAAADPSLAVNIAALEQVQPQDLGASEISVRLGSTWIDKSYVQQFMYELFKTPRYFQDDIRVHFSPHSAEWNISGKSKTGSGNILANVTYGTRRMNAYRILEETLNLRDVRVYDNIRNDAGNEIRVLNKIETTLAQQKQESIKQAFKDWIFSDPDRRQALVALYNERFNSIRPREYDGSHITFSGMSPDIALRQHQRNAIAHVLYGGNTLLAHEVGAGKTFEMVAAAMESKRLGLCRKSLFAVPNHLTEQMAAEFLRLYPAANILVATRKDFETKNRKKFCARIATGDYDAVIIGHSQLEKIPMSKERQERLLEEQIWEISEGILEVKENNGERFTIKQLEKSRKSLETKLKKLTDDSRKDDIVTFEQLGVDRLFVDESQNFKNLFLVTKMRNVAGLSQTEAQKSSDLFSKCRYLDEITDGKGIIFATGTPISNSMTEMFTLQRYLQYDKLQRAGLTHFDSWASTFGETTTAIELAPEGTGYRARTRFAKFHNMPELMNMFKETADIKTADTLDLPRPIAHFETIVAKPTELQKEMVQALSERAAEVHAKRVDPSKDNMLKITTDGRKIGLDQRLINPLLPDDPRSKVNACMENVFRIWDATAALRATQLLFCDFSTPKPGAGSDGRFNVYDDIRAKLIDKGIPANEIAFIHEADTETKKKELFAKVRQGSVRVLMGSTFKMGAGTNVQDRLIAIHDLDCPWRPSDLEQRAGRIVRQGNMHPEVQIYRYVTEGTFDSYLFQTVEQKQRFISQIMTSKSPVRSCEDVDEAALSYSEIKALCAGNPLIKERMDLDIEVSRLRVLKADHRSQRFRLEDNVLKYYPEAIEAVKGQIAGFEKDIARLSEHAPPPEVFAPMTIKGETFSKKGEAGKALLEVRKQIETTIPIQLGSYRGFEMSMALDSFYQKHQLTLKGDMSHTVELGGDIYGNITRIDNVLTGIPERLNEARERLEGLHQQVENARQELQKPFEQEAELTQKEARLAELDAELNLEGRISENASLEDVESTDAPEALSAKSEHRPVIAGKRDDDALSTKPSLLSQLKQGVVSIAEKSAALIEKPKDIGR